MYLSELFDKNKFVVTVELPPPKGTEVHKTLDIAKSLKGKVDGINVTDNQRAIMRMSSLAFSHLIKDTGNEPILQICCRDRNRIALKSDILGAGALGIKNLCLMTGDHTLVGDHPEAKPVFDIDSIELIQMAQKMDGGKNISSNFSFSIGGVTNPFSEPFDLQKIKLKKKVQAGAIFFQTQPFFDHESILKFIDDVKGINAKFLIGVTPLKSIKMIDFMNKNILTKPIPESIAIRIEKSNNQALEGIKVAVELIKKVRDKTDNINGIHIMPVGLESHLPDILNKL
ncbi:MAG TPA: methylenetetrahydrofolate reductase [Nitrospinota bacterium]|jgi:5,10-methylenetetrahydrofolate reductase|nr:methylenetetrahydrofolate reductase [Nitrospinota bacterium]